MRWPAAPPDRGRWPAQTQAYNKGRIHNIHNLGQLNINTQHAYSTRTIPAPINNYVSLYYKQDPRESEKEKERRRSSNTVHISPIKTSSLATCSNSSSSARRNNHQDYQRKGIFFKLNFFQQGGELFVPYKSSLPNSLSPNFPLFFLFRGSSRHLYIVCIHGATCLQIKKEICYRSLYFSQGS